MKKQIVLCWLRRDLRIHDHAALYHALQSGFEVLPIFIFDSNILKKLNPDNKRVVLIYKRLQKLKEKLAGFGKSFAVLQGDPPKVFEEIIQKYEVKSVYCNEDYEPFAILRDQKIKDFLESKNISFLTFKDQVLFEKAEIQKDNQSPYTVFTPYFKKWSAALAEQKIVFYDSAKDLSALFSQENFEFPSLESLGFVDQNIALLPALKDPTTLGDYEKNRDFPFLPTTNWSVYLRFGFLSVRELANLAIRSSPFLLRELAWREFFMMLLWHFPHLQNQSFRAIYDELPFENNLDFFEAWKTGKTGFALIDAGMHQLNQTGYMPNRIRMLAASFLCKQLLIHWSWGEKYFAEKLLDYDLSANNGNWQWAAGSGCDAAPYFRVFNPLTQQEKFDPDFVYIRKYIPNFHPKQYLSPIVDLKKSREKCLLFYKTKWNPS